MAILLDTGPWVAYLVRNENNHLWAKSMFALHAAPLLTCEAVVAETCYLLARGGFDPARALEMLDRGAIAVQFDLNAQVSAVRSLFTRYGNVPASLADACLVRMSELHERCKVLTLDSDFKIYRRHGRRAIPTLMPP